jgi:hypothetical protein
MTVLLLRFHCRTWKEIMMYVSDLVPDVFANALQLRFRRVDVAGCIDGNPFPHSAFDRIRRSVRRNEDRQLAVVEAANLDTSQPARVCPL